MGMLKFKTINMKTANQIQNDINLKVDIIQSLYKDKGKDVPAGKSNELRQLRQAKEYILNPHTNKDSLIAQLNELQNKLIVIDERFQEWKANLSGSEISKYIGKEREAWNRINDVPGIKRKIKMLNYILDK